VREVELKGILPHPDAAIAALEAAGATLLFRGRLEDRRYDTPERSLALRDLVLRLRIYRTADRVEGHLDWKGPTQYVDGYKVREEETTTLGDPAALAVMLEQLGYVVTREIDREIVQYRVAGEVEGEPAAIEAAIRVLGVPRAAFTTGRLPDFVREFEARTGERAALCDRELAGDYRYATADA